MRMDDERENREREAYTDLLDEAMATNRKHWWEKYNSHLEEGKTEQEAIQRAEEKDGDIKMFVMKYNNLIHINLRLLQNGTIHERVFKSVEDFIQAGLTERKAISQ